MRIEPLGQEHPVPNIKQTAFDVNRVRVGLQNHVGLRGIERADSNGYITGRTSQPRRCVEEVAAVGQKPGKQVVDFMSVRIEGSRRNRRSACVGNPVKSAAAGGKQYGAARAPGCAGIEGRVAQSDRRRRRVIAEVDGLQLSVPGEGKPIDFPSGDQNGKEPPSAPSRWAAAGRSSERNQLR